MGDKSGDGGDEPEDCDENHGGLVGYVDFLIHVLFLFYPFLLERHVVFVPFDKEGSDMGAIVSPDSLLFSSILVSMRNS